MRQKLKNTLLTTSLLALLGAPAQGQTFVPGFLKFEAWAQAADGTPFELAGANLDDATVLPLIPTFGPPEVLYMNSFNTRSVYPDDSHNNYLARITGVITVPETADYHVYVRSDDDSRVYLNRTGETPPDITSGTEVPLIREELDCCDPFIQPGIDTDGDGFGDANADGTPNTDAEATTITPIRLTVGQRYGITVLLKEGGGGDWLELDVRKVGDTRANAPLGAASIGTTVPALAITTQPAATVTATENFPVTLSVRPRRLEYPGVTYQWRVGGTAIPGATNDTYTFIPVLADDNKAYSVVLTAGGTSATSANSVLDVGTDTTAPTIAVTGSFVTRDAVLLQFSEPIGTGLATAANYTLSGGATVTSATAVGNNGVLLRTSPLTGGTAYTVTASNLRDLAAGGGNLLTPNTTTFTQVAPPAGTTPNNIAEFTRYAGATLDGLDDTIAGGTPPDATVYVSSLESQVNVADGYTGRVQGYFVPPVTGNYIFFASSDDAGRFFLSTDSDPANKKLIAQETGWSAARSWISSGGGSNLDAKRSDRFPGTEWPGGNTITLAAGVPYYMEIRYQEGGGGDNGEMTFKLEGEPDPASGTPSRITGTNLVWYIDVSSASPILTRISSGTNYNKGARIELSVQAVGQTPLTYQWYRNKQAIAGATSSTYLIASADHRHIGDYSVTITNPAGELRTMGSDNNVRLLMNGAFLIEAEDYNYEAGKTLPAASQMPYRGNAYLGLKPTLDIDFFNDGDESGNAAFAYTRHVNTDEGVVEMKGPGDAVNNAFNRDRGTFSVTNNYAIGWTDVGDWQNYTRTFPTGRYAIYIAAAHDGLPADEDANNEINMVLSRVANATVADGSSAGVEGGTQGLTKVGTFLSKATGAWSSNDLIPLTDDNGNLVETTLGGTQTLRLTFNEADGDADYFLLYCLDCAAPPQGAEVSITKAPGGNISITFTGTLQSSTSVNGPYTDVAGATNPYTPPAGQATQFFRSRQ